MSKTISALFTTKIIIHEATVNEIALLLAEIPQFEWPVDYTKYIVSCFLSLKNWIRPALVGLMMDNGLGASIRTLILLTTEFRYIRR